MNDSMLVCVYCAFNMSSNIPAITVHAYLISFIYNMMMMIDARNRHVNVHVVSVLDASGASGGGRDSKVCPGHQPLALSLTQVLCINIVVSPLP